MSSVFLFMLYVPLRSRVACFFLIHTVVYTVVRKTSHFIFIYNSYVCWPSLPSKTWMKILYSVSHKKTNDIIHCFVFGPNKKFAIKTLLCIPPQINYVATLPYETKNATFIILPLRQLRKLTSKFIWQSYIVGLFLTHSV